MRIVLATVTLVLIASVCNLCNLSSQIDKSNTNSSPMATPTPSPAPAKASSKTVFDFPQKVDGFSLQDTYDKSELKGDDELLPGAKDVIGAVYKSSKDGRKEQVMAGSYDTATAAAEAARDKRVSTSKYPARWTNGERLFVSTDAFFKDKLRDEASETR